MSVYVWGFGKHGQIGNGKTDTVHTPVRPSQLPSCLGTVQCGGYYTAAISTDGRIFTFGCGKYGRLGTGDENDRTEPVLVKPTEDVKFKEVACGIWHGAAVTTDGQLYIWGYGKSHGVLGSPNIQPASPPMLLPGPFSGKVAGVSCGNNFTLLWTTDGQAFSWGCGRHGTLGHGDETDKVTPTVIDKLKDSGRAVTFVSAGFAHSGAVTSDGHVYMFGKATDGALGLGKAKYDNISTPMEVESLRDKGIYELSCSVGEKHGHTLFVSSSGCVYSAGDGYKGKLGLGDQDPRLMPTEIPKQHFNNEHVIHVSSGGIHSAAVTREGHVFTWGCGSDGRLGHPDGQGHRYLFRSDTPRLVDGLTKTGLASHVTCSYYHTAALVTP